MGAEQKQLINIKHSYLTLIQPCVQKSTLDSTSNSMRETISELILRLADFFAVDSLLCMKCPGCLNKAQRKRVSRKYILFILKSEKQQISDANLCETFLNFQGYANLYKMHFRRVTLKKDFFKTM